MAHTKGNELNSRSCRTSLMNIAWLEFATI